jgi:hypothetical protein
MADSDHKATAFGGLRGRIRGESGHVDFDDRLSGKSRGADLPTCSSKPLLTAQSDIRILDDARHSRVIPNLDDNDP